MFKRIDHVELYTAEPERALRFYTGVLGFAVRSRAVIPIELRHWIKPA
jgi:catechol 2,3-dioxygenase-like lactoylglutathione lyase family enzyme